MTRPLLQRIRMRLGKKYLDWAEALPTFHRGVFSDLQTQRQFQRRQANDTYNETRPPANTSIEFAYLRLCESFQIEDFGALRRGIYDLFPPDTLRWSREGIDRMFDSMHAGSWSRVGLITREQSMMMKPVRQISTLPREVDLIEVALSKTLASMIMLTLDVRLNEAATQRLRDLHARHYLPSVQFTPLVPYSSRRLGSSQTTSEIEMRATILNSFRALRADIEGALTPWVSGYFTEIAGSSRPCLPAIEAFVLRGVPTEEAAFRAWRAAATRWLRSLGFEPEFNAFKGDWLMFWLPDRRDDDGMPPSRVAILAEQYRQAYPDVGGYQEERLAIYHRSKEILGNTTEATVLIELLRSVRQNVGRLRRLTVRARSIRQIPRISRRDSRLADVIHRESLMLDRLLLDFKQSQRLIRQLFIREVGNLRLLEPFKGETTEKILPDVLIEYLEREFKFLRRHIMSIRTMFSDYLLIRNSFAMYRLQWSMWLLTLLMAVVAVTQLFGSCHTDGSHAVK